MGLPDIEAYIGQEIPRASVDPELLVAQPRAPRPQVEAEAEDGESIGELFKEVREARAAEDAKRGGGRSRSGGRGERSGGRGGHGGERREGGSRSGESRGPRKPRSEQPSAPVGEQVSAPAPAQLAPGSSTGQAQDEGERGPRKRRRRRGGRRVEGAAPQAGTVAATAPASTPAAAQPSLLTRIGRGLKSLVTRSPSKQH
jgi:ATP-dependent RNA helicase RhlB